MIILEKEELRLQGNLYYRCLPIHFVTHIFKMLGGFYKKDLIEARGTLIKQQGSYLMIDLLLYLFVTLSVLDNGG